MLSLHPPGHCCKVAHDEACQQRAAMRALAGALTRAATSALTHSSIDLLRARGYQASLLHVPLGRAF